MKRVLRVFCIFIVVLLSGGFPLKAYAIDQAVAEVGTLIYGGTKGKSISETFGFFARFQAQPRKGIFRPYASAMIEYASGTASVSSEKPSFTMYSGMAPLGIDIYPFKTNFVRPFIGAMGILGWGAMTMNSSTESMNGTTTSIEFGYGATCGVEIRTREQAESKAFRISTSYRVLQGKFATIAGFQLNAITFGLGIVF